MIICQHCRTNLKNVPAQVFLSLSIPNPPWRTKIVATVCTAIELSPGSGANQIASKAKKPRQSYYRQAPSVKELPARSCQGRRRSGHPFPYDISPFTCFSCLHLYCSQRVLLRLWQSCRYRGFGPGLPHVRTLEVEVSYSGANPASCHMFSGFSPLKRVPRLILASSHSQY